MAETTEQYRNRITEIANSIENEPYIKEMREDIAEGISTTGNRQADIEDQFQELIDNTTGKDVIAAPELIAARNGKPNLKTRIDDLENETNAQLAQKASINYVDAILMDVAKGQINGPLNSVSILESTYPNGTTGVWIVFDSTFVDGAHSFKWDDNSSVWRDLGVYQAKAVEEDSITAKELNDYTEESGTPMTIKFNLEKGTVSSDGTNSTVDAPNRLRSNFVKVQKGDAVLFDDPNFTLHVYLYLPDHAYQGSIILNPNLKKHIIQYDGFIKIGIRDAIDPTKTIAHLIPDFQSKIRIKNHAFYEKTVQMGIDTKSYLSKVIKTGKNKANVAESVRGYLNDLGEINLGSQPLDYETTPHIDVVAGEVYNSSHTRKLALYDEYGTVYQFFDNTDAGDFKFTPSKNGTVRISYPTGIKNSYQLEVGETRTPYEPYYNKFIYEEEKEIVSNPLKGKELLSLGDSIASPSSVNNNHSYPMMIAERNGMLLRSESIGGATMGDNSDTRSYIYAQYQSYKTKYPNETPSYCLLNGMTNDILYSEIGEVATGYDGVFDTLTYCGGFENLLSTLKRELPKTKLLYVFPHKMNTRDYALQIAYHEKAVQILKKWSVPYVDLFEEGGLNTIIEEMRIYTDGGTHPTESGNEIFFVPPVEAGLKSI